MGAPKATETPAALEADKISRFLASFFLYFLNMFGIRLPRQQATCTSGPSFPNVRPEATERQRPTTFIFK